MRALWVDAGNDPDYTKCVQHHISHLYFALCDPRVTLKYLETVSARGFGIGVYAVPHWPSFKGETGASFATEVAQRIAPLRKSASFPKVQLDAEQHDPLYIASMLDRWRQLRPNQDTSWTLESFQGGWFGLELVRRILEARVRVVPQYYEGDMAPLAADRAFVDLLKAGLPAGLITGFYDAAALPGRWDGFAFTQGRLP